MLNFSFKNKTIMGFIHQKYFLNRFHQATKIINDELTKNKEYIFDVIIVNDQEIKTINKLYRKIDKVTDVISFALNDAKFKTNLLGEIYIDIYQAKRQNKKKWKQEVLLLFIHGILHLLGYDHDNKKKEKIMFEYQEKVLSKINF